MGGVADEGCASYFFCAEKFGEYKENAYFCKYKVLTYKQFYLYWLWLKRK